MQLALAALTKIGSLLGGAGAAAGAAGAATSAGLGGAQTIVSVLSAVGTVMGGLSAAATSRDQADNADLQAGQEQVEATQRQTKMKRSLLNALGENDVAFAAAGIDITGGIAQDARATAEKRASEEITIDRRDSDFRRALLKMRADGYRRQAGAQIGGALLSAAGSLLDAGISGMSRGGGGTGGLY